MSTARSLTFADATFPRTGLLRDALLIVGASLATALAARAAVPVPWSPVPLTGQTLAVLLTGAALGARRGALAQALYLAEGAAGLPVFAGGAGPLALVGPSAGFLLAFPLAAALTGALAERGWDRGPWRMALAMALGNLVLYVPGAALLARFVPADRVLAAGVLPFLPGDALKIAVAAIGAPLAWRWIGSPRNGSAA
jgi:biotin transport system substrate-specific component